MKTVTAVLIVAGYLFMGCSKEDPIPDNSFKDVRDNHIYRMITIGTQVWMAENLAYLPEVSNSITGSETIKHYYIYG